MRKSALWVVALVSFFAPAVHAQDLTGTWQGTLQAGRDLRIVVKISKDDASGLKAVLYSIDQTPQGIGGTVTVQGTSVKMVLPGAGASYEGALRGDAGAMEGNWIQGSGRLPLTLTRVAPEAAWAIPEATRALRPMASDAPLVFEVASIKPSRPEMQGKGITFRGRQFITINTSLSDLVSFAYGIHARQIIGAPGWTETDKYDITATLGADGLPNETQLKTMLRALLTERFTLAFHRDQRELPVYAIVQGPSGSKLTKSEADPNSLPGIGFGRPGAMMARNANMSDLAGVMQSMVLDRPVIDRTGLAGRFDFTLTWTPDQFQCPGLSGQLPAPVDNGAPGLFGAMQEQLGLKLDSTRAAADVLVIDRVERPTAN
jgi:bla regulator protein blaR1